MPLTRILSPVLVLSSRQMSPSAGELGVALTGRLIRPVNVFAPIKVLLPASAAKRLGEIYDKGLAGVSRDYAESLKWYNAARVLGEDVPMAKSR